MKILLSNDDGVKSIGLLALKKAVEGLGDLLVVAPKDNRSCASKALSMEEISVEKITLEDGSEAYAISGYPADAFFIATFKILGRKPDLVISGINIGPNLGTDDFLSSGTVGAALEAAIHGVPAIAISYSTGAREEVTMEELDTAMKVARLVAQTVLEEWMPDGADLLAINVPAARPRGVAITKLSDYCFGDIYVECESGQPGLTKYKAIPFLMNSYVAPEGEVSSDLCAVKEHMISVTPIRLKYLQGYLGEKLVRALSCLEF